MYTTGEAHGTSTSSTIKINVDKLSSYASKLDTDTGLCSDRSTLNLQTGVGTGTVTTYNKGYLRVEESDPTLTCENQDDFFSTSTSSIGNKALTYPIGLITVDEVMLAGHAGGIFDGNYNHQKNNKTSYLSIENVFWTMTPVGDYNSYGYDKWVATNFVINKTGQIGNNNVLSYFSIRPVVNIRSNVTITGNGTMTDPYIIN